MKSRDLALIIVAVVLGAVFSEVINKLVFSKSASGTQVEVVPVIYSGFPTADSRYFNIHSIDPTQFISIGNAQNTNPFNTGSNTTQ